MMPKKVPWHYQYTILLEHARRHKTADVPTKMWAIVNDDANKPVRAIRIGRFLDNERQKLKDDKTTSNAV
jgi:hypothetical protein